MNPGIFLLALAGLAGGTYAMRLAGVKLGQLSRSKAVDADGAELPEVDSASPARVWMDRATVVLIGAVAASNLLFDGQELTGPARIIGAGVGILAAILRAPMLVCVVIAMAVCAGLRAFGMS